MALSQTNPICNREIPREPNLPQEPQQPQKPNLPSPFGAGSGGAEQVSHLFPLGLQVPRARLVRGGLDGHALLDGSGAAFYRSRTASRSPPVPVFLPALSATGTLATTRMWSKALPCVMTRGTRTVTSTRHPSCCLPATAIRRSSAAPLSETPAGTRCKLRGLPNSTL